MAKVVFLNFIFFDCNFLKDLAKAAILILANKQDMKGALSAAQISSEMNLSSIKSHRWQIQACCALTGEGIDKGFEWIASNIP